MKVKKNFFLVSTVLLTEEQKKYLKEVKVKNANPFQLFHFIFPTFFVISTEKMVQTKKLLWGKI